MSSTTYSNWFATYINETELEPDVLNLLRQTYNYNSNQIPTLEQAKITLGSRAVESALRTVWVEKNRIPIINYWSTPFEDFVINNDGSLNTPIKPPNTTDINTGTPTNPVTPSLPDIVIGSGNENTFEYDCLTGILSITKLKNVPKNDATWWSSPQGISLFQSIQTNPTNYGWNTDNTRKELLIQRLREQILISTDINNSTATWNSGGNPPVNLDYNGIITSDQWINKNFTSSNWVELDHFSLITVDGFDEFSLSSPVDNNPVTSLSELISCSDVTNESITIHNIWTDLVDKAARTVSIGNPNYNNNSLSERDIFNINFNNLIPEANYYEMLTDHRPIEDPNEGSYGPHNLCLVLTEDNLDPSSSGFPLPGNNLCTNVIVNNAIHVRRLTPAMIQSNQNAIDKIWMGSLSYGLRLKLCTGNQISLKYNFIEPSLPSFDTGLGPPIKGNGSINQSYLPSISSLGMYIARNGKYDVLKMAAVNDQNSNFFTDHWSPSYSDILSYKNKIENVPGHGIRLFGFLIENDQIGLSETDCKTASITFKNFQN